jgi:hypothetical protein
MGVFAARRRQVRRDLDTHRPSPYRGGNIDNIMGKI